MAETSPPIPIGNRAERRAAQRKSRPISADAVTVRPKQAAKMLGVGDTKMAEMIREGVVESRLVGKTRLITVRSIYALAHGEAA